MPMSGLMELVWICGGLAVVFWIILEIGLRCKWPGFWIGKDYLQRQRDIQISRQLYERYSIPDALIEKASREAMEKSDGWNGPGK
jgi:hypothetical protein